MPAPRTAAPPSPARTAGTPRRTLTPQEEAALRRLLAQQAAAGLRTAPPAGRPVVRRAAAPGRPAPRRGPGGRPRPAPRRTGAGARRWKARLGIGTGAIVVPAVAALVFTGTPATAPPAPSADGSLALAAQTTLLADAGRYRQLEQVVTQRRTELGAAEQARSVARTQADAERRIVGTAAAALYRSTPTGRLPLLALDATHPDTTSDVLQDQALADRAGRALEGDVVRAERATATLRRAGLRVADARAAVRAADREAAGALAATRADVHRLSTTVTAQLAALGTTAGEAVQQTRDQQAVQRWQAYLASLAAAGIVPPPAARLADPDSLPSGLSPAKDAAGRTVPGVAWAVIDTRPVTVLPAETVAAVSSALAQLGKPYVPGATGPDAYDCGGLTAASWLMAGYSVPVTAQDQWRSGRPVSDDDLQVGDLVFTDGGLDAGIYLGDGDVLGASAVNYRVGVRSFVAGSAAVRVTLAPSDSANAALAAVPGMGACGAPLPTPGPVSPAWGGYGNGRIPTAALCSLGVAHQELRCDAAAAYRAMSDAFTAAFGSPLCITDSYRSYSGQLDAYDRKPALAAWPGTSNHGWGLAVDLCGGVNGAGTPQWTWMNANAGRFGFVNPDWARPGAEKPEPWHWEFGHLL